MRSVAFLVNDISAIGGSTKVTVQLANAMTKQRRVKIISLFQSKDEIDMSISKEIEILTLFNKRIKIFEVETYIKMLKSFNFMPIISLMLILIQLLLSYPLLRKKLNQNIIDIDTVIVPEIYGLFFINYKYKKKVILQLHTNFHNIIANRINRFTLNLFHKKIDQLVVLTDNDKKEFEKYGFNVVKRIYNPLPEKNIEGMREFNNHLLYVGRLDYVKGIDYLLEIFKLIATNQEVYLDICGDGEMKKDIEQFIKQHHLEDKVNLHGMVDNLTPYFLQAVALIAPSRREGLPLVFLEAFSHQVPVVSFRSFTSIEDIIIQGETGYVVEIGDVKEAASKLEYLLLNKVENRLMGQKALNMLEEFKLETVINQWNSIL